jgi:hypothetical protein
VTVQPLWLRNAAGGLCALAAAEFLAAEHPDRDQDSQDAAGEPLSWYADPAYGTGDLRDAIGQAGDAAVIKPKPLAPAVEGGFTLDDFTVNENDSTVTCPNGVTRRIAARRNVTFGAACRGCPLRGRCTTSKAGPPSGPAYPVLP